MRANDAKDRGLEERLDDAVRARSEAEILVKIADIEKAAVSAQLAMERSEKNPLEDLRLGEADRTERARRLEGELEQLRRDLEIAQSALNALRLEHEEAMRRLTSVAATETGRAFIAAAFEGLWPLRRWLLRRRARRLRQSGLVDPAWYLARNPDVAEAGMDPVLHYLHHGAEEGRAPNPALQVRPED